MSNKDKFGRSSIFDLIVKGDIDAINKEATLENINEQDKKGKTPLHFACIYNNFEITQFLINKGANIHLKDENGNTPLFDAVFNSEGKEEIIKLLVSKGANSIEENNYGVSPKELAETIANFDVSHIFK
jgi:ankyrin repeat protein